MHYKKIIKKLILKCLVAALVLTTLLTPVVAYADPTECGDSANGGPVHVAIDLGCHNKGNPIMDMTFGIIRFLSDGVGLVIIASIIIAGIQYMTSSGNPQANAQAVGRIRSAVTALLVFIFAYALLNYLLPAGLLK